MQKLQRKRCDLIVANGPGSMQAVTTDLEVIDAQGGVLAAARGSKRQAAKAVFRVIEERLMRD
jgi:phosphopantothenoylcysteine synthetase/decarboxylase